MYRAFGKRLLDLLIVVPALLVLAPVMVVVAVLVRFKIGSPVIFRQQRPGFQGKPFTILKFRTMTNARDAQGYLLPEADRLLPFGKFLRSTSLDELPELINVLKGEMSLVGPRPLMMRYLPHYTHEQARRHEVKPGLTGWAQINGRNTVPWEERFKLDVWYVEHLSLALDVQIIWMTIMKVCRREGISAEGHVTVHSFVGVPGRE